MDPDAAYRYQQEKADAYEAQLIDVRKRLDAVAELVEKFKGSGAPAFVMAKAVDKALRGVSA